MMLDRTPAFVNCFKAISLDEKSQYFGYYILSYYVHTFDTCWIVFMNLSSSLSSFCLQVDDGSDFRTQSILCIPIKNAQGKVIGVSQLVNKIDGSTFNKNDENLFEVCCFVPFKNRWSVGIAQRTC